MIIFTLKVAACVACNSAALFIVFAIGGAVLRSFFRSYGRWWVLPAWMAFAVPLLFVSAAAIFLPWFVAFR